MQNKECKYYSFAGICVSIKAPDFKEWEQLAKFRVEQRPADIEYNIEFQTEISCPIGKQLYKHHGYEIYQKENARIRVIRHDGTKEIAIMDKAEDEAKHQVLFSDKYLSAWGEAMMMKILDLPRQMILQGGIFLHTSFVVWNGEAILFSGKKQIGKSTQAELWRRYQNAIVANGDRAILRKMNGKWHACGSPYSGTSNICENVICPIKSIVILSQGKENVVRKASVKEAVVSLMDNCSYEPWDKDQLERGMQIMEQIIEEVAFVKLSCLPEKGAVEVLEEYICQSRK